MRRLFSFISMVLSILAVIIFAIPSIQNPILGIEFQGGYEIVYNVTGEDGQPLESYDEVAELIASRIDIAGVKNPQVSIEQTPGSESQTFIRVCVTSQNTNELSEVLSLIESDATITFTDDEGNFLMDGSVLKEENGAVLSYDNGMPVVLLNIADPQLFGEKTGSIAGKNMIAWIGYEGPNAETGYIGDYAAFMGEGSAEEQAYASKKVIVNAKVNEAITSDTAQITGSFTADEAGQIGKLLSAGSMPYKITRSDVFKVDGAYGADAFQKSIIAGVVGLILIMVMMGVIYRIPGIISSLVLVLYTAAIIVVFNLIGGEYGPDTIAAIVIGLGMAVDACIILFERLSDELYKGRSVKAAYEESTKKSLSSILDSNITTIIAGCALYFFGKRSVKGFATMLLITTVFNVIIMLIITRLLMFLLVRSKLLDNRKDLLGVDTKKIPDINKGETQTYFGKFANINFVKATKKVLIGLCCVFALGIGFAGGHGINGAVNKDSGDSLLNFGLDFKAGATASIQFKDFDAFDSFFEDEENMEARVFQEIKELNDSTNKADKDKAIQLVEDAIVNLPQNYDKIVPTNISITSSYDSATESETLDIKIEFGNITVVEGEENLFLTNFDDYIKEYYHFEDTILQNYIDTETITDYFDISQQVSSPTLAKATVINALLSLALAFALIVLYISIRFRFTYAIASLAALFIDVLSMLSIFAIFRIQVQVEFVSAVLAIIGYSINDTVVIFDRVREIAKETNYGNLDDKDRHQIVNKALSNCATRSFWTTISTMLPVLALIFIGADATLEFSIAMLIGLISGIFSSIFVSPSLWLVLEKRHMKRLKEKAIKDAEKLLKKKNSGQPEEMIVVGIND